MAKTPTPGSGGRKRRTSKAGKPSTTGSARTTPGKRASGGAPGETPAKEAGAEIGYMQRRGMSIAKKLILCISVMIVITSALFGFVAHTIFRRNLIEEIELYGYGQAVSIRTLARRILERFEQDRDGYLESAQGKEDFTDLNRILGEEKRIHAIAIFVSSDPVPLPTQRLMWAGIEEPDKYTMPAEVHALDFPEADGEVVHWQGEYNNEPAMFFMAPLRGHGDKLSANLMVAFSVADIEEELKALTIRIAAVAAGLILAGILFAVVFARLLTRSIHTLVEDMDIVARGDLEYQPRVESSDEIGLVARALSRMIRGLREARLRELEMEKVNTDLELAQEVIANLLPQKRVQLPGYDVDASYRCAREVGGDYYDFIPVDAQRLAFVVADVSGKGIAASMIVATFRTVLRMMAPMNPSPADVLAKTNYHVFRDVKRGMFVTAVYGVLNVATRELTVASAGHNPMLVWRAAKKEVERVRPAGIALGFDKGPIFEKTIRETKLKLSRGDRVILYTDGVVECMNKAREEWGDENLDDYVAEHAKETSRDFIRGLLAVLQIHQGKAEQHDDITVTTFKIL